MKKAPFIILSLLLLSALIAYAANTIKVTTFFPAPDGAYRTLETSNRTFLATTSGNVGIGTSAPTAKLDVRGQIRIRDQGYAVWRINYVLAAQNGRGLAFWAGGPGPWRSDVSGIGKTSYLAKWDSNKTVTTSSIFYKHNTDYQLVRLGIGPTATDPQSPLSIGGNGSSAYSIYVQEDRGSGRAIYGHSSHATNGDGIYATASDTSPKLSYGVQGISPRVGVYGNGGASDGYGAYGKASREAAKGTGFYGIYGDGGNTGTGVYGVSARDYGVWGQNNAGYGIWCEGANCGGIRGWTNSSDARLKTNILTIPNAIETVKRLRGVTFEWKNAPGTREMGFVAQEVLPVLPQLIETDPHGYYGIKLDQATALLVEAAKEQQKQIDVLQKEVDQLKSS